jgi:signal transduction histidine kinase
VVKRVVEAHGFSIEVESDAGRGTTFRVRMLKRAASESAPREMWSGG